MKMPFLLKQKFSSLNGIVMVLLAVLFVVSSGMYSCRRTDKLVPQRPEIRDFTSPNIIIVLGDDVGYEIPNYTGGESYETPNLNRLANAGMQFSRCVGTPLCTPSRFELLTGKYNLRNYFADSWGSLGRDQSTIANLLRNNGYATYAAGKWQLDGGDTSLKILGFDEYAVTNPFKLGGNVNEEDGLNLYKDPKIYSKGDYIPSELTLGQYGEAIMRDSVFSFIERNKENPFFVYWAPNLCHRPFQPTPDHPDFATFDPTKGQEERDTIYYPSMVKYYDQELGALYDKVNALGIANNTLIIYIVGDNGTESDINSLFNGEIIPGAKGKTIYAGIHVPVIAIWPGIIDAGSISNNIIDFTDFFPTIADICSANIPSSYGIIDGRNFAGQFLKTNYTPRQSAYCYYDVNRLGDDGKPPVKWALDTTYQLYTGGIGFYNYIKDPYQNDRIKNEEVTPEDDEARKRLQDVIDSYE